ncbi:Cyclic di-GMP phosphodiesterase YfgF [Thiorhodovibrio winogradskyi]|uniref:Cyclic di-GMP phosphodiesterase YfgF n=1 Tax=Thiorhodovibrio winogradskyi TaxID=77007 RepID=A0ABZ0S3I6_9GAMM|nr:EAL domain-containing protein [Thiorhodovibrio winogradskyi]
MANPVNHFQLLILAAAAADAEAVLAVLKRARLPVRGAFSVNPKSLVRTNHIDLILACIGESVSAQEIASAYVDIDRRIPLIVLAPPGDQDANALHLLRAGAHGLLTPGDEDALVRAVQREWKLWTSAQQAKILHERLKRSERHLQALLKAGGEGLQSGQRLDPQAALRSLTGPVDNSGSPQSSLMDLLPPEYREALGPLITGLRADQNTPPVAAEGQAPNQPPDELPKQPPDRPQDQTAAPELDLTLKPSGGQLRPAPATSSPGEQAPQEQAPQEQAPQEQAPQEQAPQEQAMEQQLALQVSSEPLPDLPLNDAKEAKLPPLTLATSEDPLPDLSEQPHALSGREPSDEELIEQIERALDNDGFKLAYQPIVSLRGDSQERYSVLLRLLDDNRTFHAADNLLEPAARSGRLPDVDRWVIQHALRALSDRRQAGQRAHFLLSLSAVLLQDPDLLIWICDQLRQNSIRGNWVSFQIHEQDIRTLGDTAYGLASGLRQVKSKVVVSNFGQNPDSELLFNEFPLDFARLAPALTENLSTDQLKNGHVKHLLAAAQSKSIRSIAGCIEDERTLAAIWSAGADYVQGKVLGRPSSALDLND